MAAAFPSIHAAFPLIGFLVIRKYRLPAWLLYLETVRVVGVWFMIVYTGEHYVVDVLAGIAYALAAWWLVQRLRDRNQRDERGHRQPESVEVVRVELRDRQPTAPIARG